MGQEDIEVKNYIDHSKVKAKYLKLIFENKSDDSIMEFWNMKKKFCWDFSEENSSHSMYIDVLIGFWLAVD